MRAVAVIPRGG